MGPILGALILQAAYGAVDLLVVGRFGSTAGLSAVSTGSQVLNLVTFVITALAMGVTVLIARYIGVKNTDQIGELLGGATTIFAILAVVLAVVMVTFARPLSVLMQAPAEAVTLTSSYVRICGGGIFFRLPEPHGIYYRHQRLRQKKACGIPGSAGADSRPEGRSGE